MIVTPLHDLVLGDWVPDPNRSAGLHLSDIIKAMMVELEPAKYGSPMDVARVEAGLAFERVFEEGLKRKWPGRFRPSEVCKDGIAMSPDGLDPQAGTLEEFKCTWRSSRGCPDDPKFRPWLWQIKAYCHALRLTRARLRAFFVNGDYSRKSPGGDPGLLSWDLAFEPRELEENWAMLVNFAKAKGMLR